jgi:hypothetical protein
MSFVAVAGIIRLTDRTNEQRIIVSSIFVHPNYTRLEHQTLRVGAKPKVKSS